MIEETRRIRPGCAEAERPFPPSAAQLAAKSRKRFTGNIKGLKRLGQPVAGRNLAGHADAGSRSTPGPAALAIADMFLRTLDGEAFLVEKIANPLKKRDIVRPVIASATAALQRAQGGELGLPETKYMRRNVKMLGYLGNRAERI